MVPRGRALITGVAGQDGSYLAELLVGDGWDVVGLVRPPAGRPAPNLAAVAGRVELIAVDMRDAGAIVPAIRTAAPDRIYHLAAPSYVPASWEDPAATLTAIATGTAAVLHAAREVGARVLVAASPEMFGDAGEHPQHEGSPRRPRTPYGVAKLAAHELVRVMREHAGVHACSVIPYNHESPRRSARFVSRAITSGVAAIATGRARTLRLGNIEAVRDWTHARDVVRGMHLALSHPDAADYVLAGGVGRTVREFAAAAFAAAGLDPEGRIEIDPGLSRPPEGTPPVGDASRARRVLGWRPEVTFEELVAEMVAADLAH